MALRVKLASPVAVASWRDALPTLRTDRVILRELQKPDARDLLDIATREEVTRFTWPAPDGVSAVRRFIQWTHDERAAGRYLCYGVFSPATTAIAGMFELRRLQPDFFRAETGFFLAPDFWGTGMFNDAARLVLDFAFQTVGIHRVEARIAVDNDRSNAAMLKLGALREGVLHDAFVRNGEYVDQFMWALLRQRYLEAEEQRSPG